jgi:hypothetical protein
LIREVFETSSERIKIGAKFVLKDYEVESAQELFKQIL